MRIRIDEITSEDRQVLKTILKEDQTAIEFEITTAYQLRRISLLLGQLVRADIAETVKAQKNK